ncbi:helix-turn-helix transcriptional regulator [Dongia sedimenti]|uniref:Helix-turn-helix transcriptional regulator n=1 Tax=Dongia sedimenti TaxID=3064282 RepID=A0ABU0YV26_9PROT|nr:helix-turn-helix transcriptional regulator [Rhodospirillaceae bacterium R-7]
MGDQRGIEQTVGLFYDAAYAQSAGAWSAVGQQIVHSMAAKGCLLQIADMRLGRSQLLATPGCEGLNMPAYAEHYVRHDLWAQMATPERADRALLMHDLVAPVVWERSEIYNDFVRPGCDFFWCLGAAIPLRDGQIGLLGVLRNQQDAHFSAVEAAELDRLLPHLRRSLQLTQQLRGLELDLAHARAGLDALSIGVVVCNAAAKVQVANRIAEEILRRGDGIARDGAEAITLDNPDLQQSLRRMIASAARRSSFAPDGAGGALRIARHDGPALKLLVAPLPAAQHIGLGGTGGAMILIDDPARNAAPAIEALKALFSLTGAEARLARRMAHGDATVPEIAAEFALSPQTIRTQMKSIHRKMEVSHQAEISATISRLGLLGQ